ncbi:uncharacterized protein PFL1_04511 [Pseudozyma flocculosa PF-1]|uniref:chorismate mutase n=2 Tax=Pseudozyma flocculosa TaxID=84751 RepID=A0A5C3FCH2_9BASI|nr:uncharacterized protein PFL1_04511 [Pseudozyma flocculosa PF-1]EPQ27765.1 hypothetical protein PFL1_04511 [Pseudozyma flocculosa PF-1]SPO41109.1 uncharacterized protein PSFLO_06591 [Pseudozyma flocculosa]
MKLVSLLVLLPLLAGSVSGSTRLERSVRSTPPSSSSAAARPSSGGDAAALLTAARNKLEETEDALLHSLIARGKLAGVHGGSGVSDWHGCADVFKSLPAMPRDNTTLPHQWKGHANQPDFLLAHVPSSTATTADDDAGGASSSSTIDRFFYANIAGALSGSPTTAAGAAAKAGGAVAEAGAGATRAEMLASSLSLQLISDRIHIGEDVARAKLAQDRQTLCPLIAARDSQGLVKAVTNTTQEQAVLDRVLRKVSIWSARPAPAPAPAAGAGTANTAPATTSTTSAATSDPDAARIETFANNVQQLFKQFLIPLTTQLEVVYLLSIKCD